MSIISTLSVFLTVLCALSSLTLQINAGSVEIGNIRIKWANRGHQTQFKVISPLKSYMEKNQAWLAIGFNSEPKMSGANVVVCKIYNGKSVVQNYFNNGHSPALFDAKKPSLGITKTVVHNNGREVMCSFSRDNADYFTFRSDYYHIQANSTPFIIAAYGNVDNDGVIYYHEFRGVSPMPMTFEVKPIDQSLKISNVKVSWRNEGEYTSFQVIVGQIGNTLDKLQAWMSFSLNSHKTLVGATTVFCKSYSGDWTFQHYVLDSVTYKAKFLLDENDPTFGLENTIGATYNEMDGGSMLCYFRRRNILPNAFEIKPLKPAYFIVSYGSLDKEGKIDNELLNQIFVLPQYFPINDGKI